MAQPHGRALGLIVFAVTAFLLLTMGGAIVAAPLTLPLLVLVARRRPTHAFVVTAAVLAAATTAEVAWALTYVAAGEAQPWIWLLPAVAAAGAATAIVRWTLRPVSLA